MATKNKEDVVAAIKAGNKAVGAAIAAGDSKAAAALYTKTAKLLPGNMLVQKGHAAIARFWKGAIETGIRAVQLRTADVDVHGTTASELGAYMLNDAKELENGKCIVVSKNERGKWKLHCDMFSTNNPA